jgi:DNA-binding transcriptional ArsR family regulator
MSNDLPTSSECAKWLKALGEPLRLEIVRELLNGPLSVTAISEAVGVEMVIASHHLQVLLHAGLVCVEKEGRFSVYRLNPEFLATRSRHGNTFDFGCCRFEFSAETP